MALLLTSSSERNEFDLDFSGRVDQVEVPNMDLQYHPAW